MPVVSEMRHPRGFDFATEREIYRLRKDEEMSFEDIAGEVRNISGDPGTKESVRRTFFRFSPKQGRSKYKFSNCGRRAWVVTPAVEKFVIKTLLKIRRSTVCTSTTLQEAVAKELKIKVSDSAIRKLLKKKGYKWLTRAQKRAYSAEDKKKRKKFADAVLRLSKADLRKKLCLSMDGVVLTRAPEDPTDRLNFCRQGETHMWRKPNERAMAELSGGGDDYPQQVSLSRVVPMWGGISEGGAAVITFHKKRKFDSDEWVQCLKAGKLTDAIKAAKPISKRGPWHVLCDNEKFLKSKKSMKAYGSNVKLWFVPPRSPDLNPVEKFWAWLRKELRRKDLQDLQQKRQVIGRTVYIARVRTLMRSKRAQTVASNIAAGFRKVCKTVSKKKGAHSGK